MMRQRGFDTVQLVIVVVILGILSGAAVAVRAYLNGVEERGYQRGLAEKQAEWDAAKLAAADAERRRQAAVGQALLVEEKRRAAAEDLARAHAANLKEARREATRTRVSLGSCPQPVAEPARAGAGDVAAAGGDVGVGIRPPSDGGDRAGASPGIRVHWRFVGLHDAAFTGLDGKPLFGAASRYALDAARTDTPSPYGLDDVLEVNAANAEALGTCLREYAGALNKIDAAAAAWDKGSQ